MNPDPEGVAPAEEDEEEDEDIEEDEDDEEETETEPEAEESAEQEIPTEGAEDAARGDEKKDDDDGGSAGSIVSIAAGVIALGVVACLIGCYVYKKRKQRPKPYNEEYNGPDTQDLVCRACLPTPTDVPVPGQAIVSGEYM